MTEEELVLPRRLAIAMLHEAQIAQPEAICGAVLAEGGRPVRFVTGPLADGVELWARLWSVPQAPAEPDARQLADGGLHLVISLNTKGVLEMRAWQLHQGQPRERVLKLPDL
jgi:hypothetical protein